MAATVLPGELIGHQLPANAVPGVFVDLVQPQPTTEFTTGLPVFLGYGALAASGKVIGDPVPLTRIDDFYNSPLIVNPDPYLMVAVQGFFQSGGTECRVVLLDPSVAREAQLPVFSPVPGPRPPQPDPAQAVIDLWANGIASIDPLDEFDLICTPSLMLENDLVVVSVQTALLAFCDRRGDCFAILDAIGGSTDRVLSQCAALQASYGARSGALYFPWVLVDGQVNFFPPCGHVAGVYRLTDEESGFHKAPANEVLQGVADLSLNLNDGDHRALKQPNLNCIRAFPGRGIRVWGARTLEAIDTNWTFINVRRLFTTIARALQLTMAWSTFEPNEASLWVRATRELNLFCLDLFQRGALKGRTADEAFFVKCDDETNSPAQRDLGVMVSQIGLAPATPGEFIIVRLTQSIEGVSVTTGG